MSKIVLFVLTLSCSVFLVGCPVLRSACEKALPVLVAGQSYGTDATNAIAQAEAYAAQLPLSADTKAQLADAINEARRGIEAGVIALAAASGACAALDPIEAFKILIAAWPKIENLLGGIAVSGNLMVARRPLYVPAIVRATRISKQ